jgi:cytochrome c553
MTRILILIAVLIAPVLVNSAEPESEAKSGSQIAWTTETLKLVKNGNAEKGRNLAESCKACHGLRGEGMPAETRDDETIPAIPALAGQVANYTFKQLRDYFNGDRSNDSMTAIAKGLSEQDAADLAAWYASLAPPKPTNNKQDVSTAEKMVEAGDGKRILPPCFVCHGANGQGEKMDIPSLVGQQAHYFERTLMQYRSGERHNDIYSRMRLIAKQLSEAEIKALSLYYQQLK